VAKRANANPLIRVDKGRTNLAVCLQPGCPWRGFPTESLTVAWHQAARHESDVHDGGDGRARKAYHETKSREVGARTAKLVPVD